MQYQCEIAGKGAMKLHTVQIVKLIMCWKVALFQEFLVHYLLRPKISQDVRWIQITKKKILIAYTLINILGI